MFLLAFLLTNSFFSTSSYVASIHCMNDIGKPVDYWVVIKKPQGSSYFYYDSDNKLFNSSPYSLNDTSSGALSYTTKQLWFDDANYVIYNDQVPKVFNKEYDYTANADDVANKFGHTKGYFAFDTYDNGFWLTHSIPLFPVGPNNAENYLGLGNNAKVYAQHLLCFSLKSTMLNDMAKLFLLNRPQIYDAKLTTEKYETIKHLIDGYYSIVKECDIMNFITSSGTLFTLFAKTAEWNNDLYAGCVTPSEKDTLWVESWIRGSAEGPVCPISDYNTLDINYLDFGTNSWSETQDHSKWAITANKKTICMGDINRMTTQYSRGGGTACFSDSILHNVLKTATTKTNYCT